MAIGPDGRWESALLNSDDPLQNGLRELAGVLLGSTAMTTCWTA